MDKTHAVEQLIAGLSDRAAYPHPTEKVAVMQTHISCVFLTGAYAYKVKKPVKFGFLDYSTAEARHAFCNQEIALNRRLCPDIYVDTVPITLENGRLKVCGSGEPVEWAVRMRQLRAEEMLTARLDSENAEEAVRRVAVLLADFHEHAASTPSIRAWGAPDVIARTIGNTLDTMDSLAVDTLTPDARARIRRCLETFLKEQEGLLRRRMETGCIRDCHGDLRVQNICLDPRFDGGIQIFDCIEFNKEFRYIDVAADIAYLAMDLDLVGRADLREILVDTYSRASSDLRSVLRFYQTYRACVRGNIALLAAGEGETEKAQREAHGDMAAAAYDLALSHTRAPAGPALLITVGFSGSGKTAVARVLSRRLPAVLLSSDRVRKEAAGAAQSAALEPAWYTAERRAEVYADLCRRAGVYLARGEHVVLDATFLAAPDREAALQAARKYSAEFWILECRCPDAIIRERLRARQKQPNASDAGLAVYEEQLRCSVPILLPEGVKRYPRHIEINTDQPVWAAAHEVIEQFAAYL